MFTKLEFSSSQTLTSFYFMKNRWATQKEYPVKLTRTILYLHGKLFAIYLWVYDSPTFVSLYNSSHAAWRPRMFALSSVFPVALVFRHGMPWPYSLICIWQTDTIKSLEASAVIFQSATDWGASLSVTRKDTIDPAGTTDQLVLSEEEMSMNGYKIYQSMNMGKLKFWAIKSSSIMHVILMLNTRTSANKSIKQVLVEFTLSWWILNLKRLRKFCIFCMPPFMG